MRPSSSIMDTNQVHNDGEMEDKAAESGKYSPELVSSGRTSDRATTEVEPAGSYPGGDLSGFGLDQPDIWGIEEGDHSERSRTDSDEDVFARDESPSDLWGETGEMTPDKMGDNATSQNGSQSTKIASEDSTQPKPNGSQFDKSIDSDNQQQVRHSPSNTKSKTSASRASGKKTPLKRQNSTPTLKTSNWATLSKGRRRAVASMTSIPDVGGKRGGHAKKGRVAKRAVKKTSVTVDDEAGCESESAEDADRDDNDGVLEKNNNDTGSSLKAVLKRTASKHKLNVPVRTAGSGSDESGSDEDDSRFRPAKPTISQAWLKAIRKLDMVLPLASTRDADSENSSENVELQMDRILTSIKAEMETAGIEELTPTVNGMRQFGVSKGGITRAVVNFAEAPTHHPLTVCFHFPHTFLNHSYVRHMVLSRIRHVPGGKVVTIQYQDRNVFHGTRCIDNRWIIKVSNKMSFEILIRTGIDVCNRRIAMRPYTDVLHDEFEEYKEYIALQKKYVYNKIKTLTDETIPQEVKIFIEHLSRNRPRSQIHGGIQTLTLIKEVADEVYQGDEPAQTAADGETGNFQNANLRPPEVIIEEEEDDEERVSDD